MGVRGAVALVAALVKKHGRLNPHGRSVQALVPAPRASGAIDAKHGLSAANARTPSLSGGWRLSSAARLKQLSVAALRSERQPVENERLERVMKTVTGVVRVAGELPSSEAFSRMVRPVVVLQRAVPGIAESDILLFKQFLTGTLPTNADAAAGGASVEERLTRILEDANGSSAEGRFWRFLPFSYTDGGQTVFSGTMSNVFEENALVGFSLGFRSEANQWHMDWEKHRGSTVFVRFTPFAGAIGDRVPPAGEIDHLARDFGVPVRVVGSQHQFDGLGFWPAIAFETAAIELLA